MEEGRGGGWKIYPWILQNIHMSPFIVSSSFLSRAQLSKRQHRRMDIFETCSALNAFE